MISQRTLAVLVAVGISASANGEDARPPKHFANAAERILNDPNLMFDNEEIGRAHV